MEPELAKITVLQIPVPLWQASQEHMDELQREFVLIATEERLEPTAHHVPRQLLDLIEELTQRYAGFSEENETLLTKAAETSVPSIDLVYEMPTDVVDAVHRLNAVLDEADEFCRQGEHLLTLETPAEQVRFRRWFLGELVRQVEGEQPMPWPDYADA